MTKRVFALCVLAALALGLSGSLVLTGHHPSKTSAGVSAPIVTTTTTTETVSVPGPTVTATRTTTATVSAPVETVSVPAPAVPALPGATTSVVRVSQVPSKPQKGSQPRKPNTKPSSKPKPSATPSSSPATHPEPAVSLTYNVTSQMLTCSWTTDGNPGSVAYSLTDGTGGSYDVTGFNPKSSDSVGVLTAQAGPYACTITATWNDGQTTQGSATAF